MTKRFVAITAAMTVAGFMGIAANAGETPSDTQQWAKDAGKAISRTMSYPRLAERQGKTGSASFVVTIGRDGDVLDYYETGHRGGTFFKSSARRSLKNVDFPALPQSFSRDKLSFTLNMEYKQYEGPARASYKKAQERKGSVMGTRIALLPTVSLSTGK